jgi:AraC family transcriptional regulator
VTLIGEEIDAGGIAARIERAKSLLAKPASSVTEIGLTFGFSDTSSFSAAFRKATGLTPTAYRRCLA